MHVSRNIRPRTLLAVALLWAGLAAVALAAPPIDFVDLFNGRTLDKNAGRHEPGGCRAYWPTSAAASSRACFFCSWPSKDWP